MTNPFYVTTPIYYVNAKPHLGHAYTTIVADVINRFHEMHKIETYFLTGTDEHGDKIVKAAKEENLSPKMYVDKISLLFKELWPQLNVNYNNFIRTTDPNHISLVESILKRIYEKGDIYFSEYEGLYCFGCERFYTERELVDGKCPDHQSAPHPIKEANYFFKMSSYQDWLISHIKQNPDFIRPERYKNEVLAFLKDPLDDLCISRPKSRLQWGITLPFDNNYVTYVWFDALLNYISAIGYPDSEVYKKFWQHAQHIVAKDILKPHAIYWTIILKAADIPLFKNLNVHGYWNIEQNKMSKSLGNVVDPLSLKNIYGVDAFRYFLMREMVFGLDASFSEKALIQRINSDLANDLGNLFSRVLAMVHKYFKGVIPEVDMTIEKDLLLGLKTNAFYTVSEFNTAMASFAFHKALSSVWEFINQMNKYVDMTAPWELAKKKTSKKQLEAVIYNLLEGLRIIAGLIYPIMPETSKTMQLHLGMDTKELLFSFEILNLWNVLKAGTQLPKGISLFPRIGQNDEDGESKAKQIEQDEVKLNIKPEITMEVLSKIDFRVATIVEASSVPNAKKILKLEIDLGERRTIVAGVATSYKPEELIGKQIIVVANLKPAKIMGILSNGMLLAAFDEGYSLATLDKKIKPGTSLN